MDPRRFMSAFLPAERSLRAYLLSATGDPHAADDLLQEVAAVLWEKFAEFDARRRFTTWALGVARLEVLKWRRQQARRREVLSPETIDLLSRTSSEHVETSDDFTHLLRRCLAKLSDAARRAIRLKYFERLKIHQVATRMDRRTPAVEMLLVRSRRALRRCFEQQQAAAGMEQTR
jgi:RNA polymerase sigma-70 factor (ECF subfamily)